MHDDVGQDGGARRVEREEAEVRQRREGARRDEDVRVADAAGAVQRLDVRGGQEAEAEAAAHALPPVLDQLQPGAPLPPARAEVRVAVVRGLSCHDGGGGRRRRRLRRW